MTSTTGTEHDELTLRTLNDDYIPSDQYSDVTRYGEFLAEDFTATVPDLVFGTRERFLDLIAQPRPFTDLTVHDVTIRVLGDFALIHGRATDVTTLDGVQREALYTDTYARRHGEWQCIAGEVVAW